MKYGQYPQIIDKIEVESNEMMFYQYLPVKMPNGITVAEGRLSFVTPILKLAIEDFKNTFGIEKFKESYIYLTVKRLYQTKNKFFNRAGYHSDGFLTDDINYIWSDSNPTIFNVSEFDITLDDKLSLEEMETQALPENEVVYDNCTLLRLDQFNIHKVNEDVEEGVRTFVKISFSKDRYDLEGNSHNYNLDYDWKMKPRSRNRNIPQSKIAQNE